MILDVATVWRCCNTDSPCHAGGMLSSHIETGISNACTDFPFHFIPSYHKQVLPFSSTSSYTCMALDFLEGTLEFLCICYL